MAEAMLINFLQQEPQSTRRSEKKLTIAGIPFTMDHDSQTVKPAKPQHKWKKRLRTKQNTLETQQTLKSNLSNPSLHETPQPKPQAKQQAGFELCLSTILEKT